MASSLQLKAKARRRRAEAEQTQPASTAEKVAANPATRFLTGAARPFIGLNEYINQAIHKVAPDSWPAESPLGSSLRQYDKMVDKGETEQGTAEKYTGKVAELGGQMLSPAYLKIMKAMGVPKGMMGKIGQGVTMGTAAGTMEPVNTGDPQDYWKQKMAQQIMGGTIGGVVPPLLSTAKGVGGAVDQFTRPFGFRNTPGNWLDKMTFGKTTPGIQKDLKEIYGDLAGDSRAGVQRALSRAGTTLSGDKQTSGQAIAQHARKTGQPSGASIARMEKDLGRATATGDVLPAINASQQAGRKKVIDAIAGSSDDMAAAKAARKAHTAPLYKTVEESTERVDATPVLSQIDDVLAKNPNESSITKPLMELRQKLVNGEDIEVNPQALSSLSKEIKAMMGRTNAGGQKEFNVKVLRDIKQNLDDQIGRAEGSFKLAQEGFKEKSIPINRMQVGGELKTAIGKSADDELIDPIESATTFLNATRNAPRTLKRSTGFNRYDKLDDVLSPEQTSNVNKVADELLTNKKLANMQSSKEGVISKLDESVEPLLPTLLHRPTMAANWILKQVGKNMGPEYERLATKLHTEPKLMNEILKRPANEAERKMLMLMMNRAAVIGAAQQGVNNGL